MKNTILILVMSLMIISCKDDDPVIPQNDVEEATIIGRWVAVGFEDNIRYEFTNDKRYTMYGDSTGVFPSLADFIRDNPGVGENDYTFSGDTVVIDLNFGNFSKLVPNFKCENKVIDWISEDGSLHSTFYREEHDITTCR